MVNESTGEVVGTFHGVSVNQLGTGYQEVSKKIRHTDQLGVNTWAAIPPLGVPF